MDLEQQLRAALAPSKPDVRVRTAVMARVSNAVKQAPGKAGHRILYGTILVALAAAAMLVTRYSDPSLEPATLGVQVEAIATPMPAVPEAGVSAQQASVPPVTDPPAAPQPQDGSQACRIAAAELPVPASFTVLLMPLQIEAVDPAIQRDAQEYYDGVVRQLRGAPGLELATAEMGTMGSKQADYRITATLLAAEESPEPGKRPGPRMKLQLDTWNGTDFKASASTASGIPAMDERMSCPFQVRNCAASMSGASAAATLQYAWLPRLTTAAQAACQSQKLESARQQIAERRRTDPSIDVAMLRNLIQNLANNSSPITRGNLARRRLDMTRPGMREPLLSALRESTDDASRREIVTLLAARFAEDAIVQQALAGVTASSSDIMTRQVAQRALTGDEPWRDFVIQRLRDTSLSTTQRLDPLYWMADTMPVNEQKLGAEVAAVLTQLQQGDGIHMLAEFLAGTNQNPRDATQTLLIQQGQRTMRQIASVNHPAVPDLLIAYFDAAPNYLTLSVLAAHRDLPPILQKLESIAAGHADPQVQKSAGNYLIEPLKPPQPAAPGH